MFGFFKKNKAIADAQKLITDLTKNIVVYDPKIEPSKLFLEDPYVLGFIKALSEVAIMFNYKNRPNHNVAGEILCKSIQKTYPKESEIVIEKLAEFNMSKNEKFIEGLKLGINYGKSIVSEISNPPLNPEKSGEKLAEIFGTMRRYIKENYVST